MIFFQNSKKNKVANIGKIPMPIRYTVFVLMLVGMLIMPVQRANAWYCDGCQGAMLKYMLENIRIAIEGAMLAALKIAAVETLNSQVGRMVTGGGYGGRPLVITNYNDFLYRAPSQRAGLYMNDFFTLTTRGKAYNSNYIPYGGYSNFRGNYNAFLIASAQQTIWGNGATIVNLEEYTPSPEQMFGEGNWRAFNAFFANPANNPFGYALQAERAYQQRLAMDQEQARIKAMSGGGFLPVERNGNVITPARTIGDVVSNVTTLGNTIIAAAQNPAELAGGIVRAVANRMINNLIQRGLGEMQTKLHREMGNVDKAMFDYNNKQMQQWGAQVMFFDEQVQRTNAAVKANTPPPPGYVKKKK